MCTLTESELQERRRTVLDSVRDSAIHMAAIPDGYSFQFEANPGVLARLANLVDLERECCRFLSFKIVVEPQQPIRLEVTGPAEARAVIDAFFRG